MIGPIPNPDSGPECASTPSINVWAARGRRAADWTLRIVNFGLFQGLVQFCLALAGIIIVRSLPKSEYALFAIANSMQVACTQLADLGVGIGVRSIGGRVWQDRTRLGELINTALGLRRQFALVAAAICFPVMWWLLRRNGASIEATAMLSVVIAASVIPLLSITVWTAALLLHGEYRRVQRLDLGNGVLRLGLIGGLAVSRINAVLAILVNAVTCISQALFLRRWSRAIADPDSAPNNDDRRELLRLSAKSFPNTVFFCFQGQVTLLILTLMGSPAGIADITALGRLSLLFSVFSVMFANVLAPRFARCQEPGRLWKLYLLLVGATLSVLLPLLVAAAIFPEPFLWLLGDKYSGLRQECGWVVAAGCASQLFGVLWSLNSSKAWISVQAVGYIPVILVAQVIAAAVLDLRQFHNVVLFTFVTAIAPIPLMIADAIVGLRSSRSAVSSTKGQSV